MPTNTSLVTNLPADFNTFGQAVDTTMAELKGGTTGQILSKTSATDMDFTWITNDVGDITAVTAGTGISGGGTSGAVTVTNSMATAITTAGDLIKGTGSGTFDRLGIGSTGQVLTVTAGAPAWATPASSTPTFVGCAVYTTTNQSIANSTYTAINFNSESIDTDGFHSTTTNTSRITIPSGKAGKYLITFHVMYDPNVTGSRSINVNKNGSLLMGSGEVPGNAGSYVYNSGSFIADLAVADYLEFMIYQTSGGALTVYCRDREKPFQVEYLGA